MRFPKDRSHCSSAARLLHPLLPFHPDSGLYLTFHLEPVDPSPQCPPLGSSWTTQNDTFQCINRTTRTSVRPRCRRRHWRARRCHRIAAERPSCLSQNPSPALSPDPVCASEVLTFHPFPGVRQVRPRQRLGCRYSPLPQCQRHPAPMGRLCRDVWSVPHVSLYPAHP